MHMNFPSPGSDAGGTYHRIPYIIYIIGLNEMPELEYIWLDFEHLGLSLCLLSF